MEAEVLDHAVIFAGVLSWRGEVVADEQRVGGIESQRLQAPQVHFTSSGDADFSIAEDAQLSPPQQAGLDHLRDKLQKLGGTGVASLISQVLYSAMDHIVAYPVQDESSWVDGEGNVLPDALVVPNNTTAKELAYAVHTDLADGFIKAVDCRSKRVIGADHELSDGDVVKIHAKS